MFVFLSPSFRAAFRKPIKPNGNAQGHVVDQWFCATGIPAQCKSKHQGYWFCARKTDN
jgi:hypothetical protein